MGLYIVTNVDGHVISSTNGINWTEPFNTGLSINKAAVGPNKIVYSINGTQNGNTMKSGLYYTSAWNQTPVLAEGTEQYSYSEVHYLGGKFVAVGYESADPTVYLARPAYAYSENGVNWTIGEIDSDFFETFDGRIEFNDVGYNGVGYFIVSNMVGEGLSGGFYTTDLSQQLSSDNWINIENFPVDAKQLVYATYPEGVEKFGVWSAFSEDAKTWWSTLNEDPSQPWSFVPGFDLRQIIKDNSGLDSLYITKATIGVLNGYVTWMVANDRGQIIWWPHIPAGPFFSVPNPHTHNVSSVVSLNPLTINIQYNGPFVWTLPLNNEKITITGSVGLNDLNNTYFVEMVPVTDGGFSYILHYTKELNSPVDASGWSGAYEPGSATATLSTGTYIDALGYGNGIFFLGNDSEEVFICSSVAEGNLVWTKVDDLNNSLSYWNDVDYGEFEGCSPTTYSYDLSPDNPEAIPNYRYDGEGNMDTSIVMSPDGSRRSIQRTGYFDYLDGCGNRKVLQVNDGDTVSDSPEIPSIEPNPTGNPLVNPQTGSTI